MKTPSPHKLAALAQGLPGDWGRAVLGAGDLQLIPAGRVHAIRPGAKAALLLFDPEP